MPNMTFPGWASEPQQGGHLCGCLSSPPHPRARWLGTCTRAGALETQAAGGLELCSQPGPLLPQLGLLSPGACRTVIQLQHLPSLPVLFDLEPPVCLPDCLPDCLPLCHSAFLPARLQYLPACLLSSLTLPFCQPACQPAPLLACLPASLPLCPCLSACPTCLSACLHH